MSGTVIWIIRGDEVEVVVAGSDVGETLLRRDEKGKDCSLNWTCLET